MVLTNSSYVLKKKATQGGKKMEMKKIEQFSSLFNKASELSALTGSEIAILVQSPAGGEVSAFGHPSVDHVLDKYLAGASGASSSMSNQILNPKLLVINEQYEEVLKGLEEEKKNKDVIEEFNEFWYDQPIDGLSLKEVQQFQESLVELKKNLLARLGQLMTTSTVKSSSSSC